MRALLFPRLVWKEYRVLRGYWFSLLAVGLLIEFFIAQFARDPQLALFSLPWAVAAFFALGAGATLFAIEREEQTIEFLRGLPASPSRLFVGKLTLVLGGTLLLGVALSAAALPVVGRDQLRNLAASNTGWVIAAPLLLQVVAWGVFFSLLLARPLVAALLATLATFVSCFVVAYVATAWDTTPGWRAGWEGLPHALMTAAVFLLDFVLTRRWLLGSARRFRAIRIARATDMRCLWWQESRQSGVVMGAVLALGLSLMLSNWASAGPHSPGSVPIATLIFALSGSCVFLADQGGGQFRYFTERGIDPRRLWLARQLFWAAPVAALMLVYLLAHVVLLAMVVRNSGTYDNIESRELLFFNYGWFGLNLGDPYRHYHQTWHVGWFRQLPGYVLWTALAYGAGQLGSMFFRSGLLAAVFGVIMAGLLVGWAALMEFLELNWMLTVAPLALALFVSTWLRAPDWLVKRADWRARLRAALVLAVPLATVLGGVAIYRVYEVPAAQVDLLSRTPEVTRFGDVEARRTADLYHRACDLLSKPRFLALGSDHRFDAAEAAGGNLLLPEPREAWLRENAKSLALALEAADRPECDFGETLDAGTIYLSPLPRLGLLIALSAQDLEIKGELDAALDRYQAALRMANHLRRQPGLAGEAMADAIEHIVFDRLPYWGARVRQTPERIQAAIDDVSKLAPFRPMAGIVEYQYRGLAHRLFTTDGSLLSTDAHAAHSAILARWLPWERTRSWRVLAYLTALDLDDVAAAGRSLAGKQTPAGYWGIDPAGHGEAIRLAQTSLFLASDALDYQQPSMGIALIDSRREAIAYRRAVRLALAAEAWRLEHDELPRELRQLEIGGGDQASLDPYTNQPFEYFPSGFRADVQSENVVRLGARTPVLLSLGRAYAGYLRERLEHVRLTSTNEAQPASASPNASGESLPGLLFPIPKPF